MGALVPLPSQIEVIDTPGFWDSECRDPLFLQNLAEFLKGLSDGLNCVVVVFPATTIRFDQNLKQMLELIGIIFGKEVWQHTRFVSTMWNSLHDEARAIAQQKMLNEWPKMLKDELKVEDANYSIINFEYDNPHSLDGLFDFVRDHPEPFVPEVTQKIS